MKLYTLIMLFVFNACGTGKMAVKTGIDEIRFGGGGGFTGQIETYTLRADCKLLKKEKELKKIDTKKTLMLFNQASELKEYKFNKPDNMYSFIEIKSKGNINRIVWPYGSTTIDKKVIELYNNLTGTTK